MGLSDQRLKKLQTLGAASRSIVLKKTRALRKSREKADFRSFRQQVEDKREKEVVWNARMAEKLKEEAVRKQETSLGQERKRLLNLEKLKELKGPFTNAEEVEEFLNSEVPQKEKQARMKKELQFARDSSTTLLWVDILFKIQVT